LRAALGAGGAGACFPNQEWNAMRASAYREERVVHSMTPVRRTLQTIAAIQSETRESVHAEAASKCPTELVHSQNVSASSLASSAGHNRPAAPSAKKGAADLNRGSGAPPIAHVKTTPPEAASAWGGDIRLDTRDRVVAVPARDVTRRATTIIIGASVLALVLCFGWIEGLNSDFFTVRPASFPVKDGSPDPPDTAKSDRLEVQGSRANTVATATTNTHETSKLSTQTTESSLTKQATRAPQPPAVERTKASIKPAPVPETRPTTIEEWTIREVNGGTAVLEGPNGVWKAVRGDTVPGVGKIDSIVRWGNRWIVATSKGLISTR
jgi:hypothetical protein